jgi:hypothetical protein
MRLTSITRVSFASVLVLVAAACGGGSSNPSTGPGSTSTPAGGGPTSAICSLVTAAEMSQFMALTLTIDPAGSNTTKCDYTTAADDPVTALVEVRYDTATLATDKTVWSGGSDQTVGGHPGYWVENVKALWVDLGSQRLVVQLVAFGAVTANEALAQQVMEKALSRI